MAQKTLTKDFIKIDEENFSVVETRETTTEVNHKRVNIELKTFKSNLKNDVTTLMKNENAIKIGCERFNAVIDDLVTANEKLGYADVVIPEKISYEIIRKEIIDEEEAIKKQQEEAKKVEEEKALEGEIVSSEK